MKHYKKGSNKFMLMISILIGLVAVFPVLFIVVGSLFGMDEINAFFNTLGHYRKDFFYVPIIPHAASIKQYYQVLIEEPKFLKMLMNSFIYTVSIVGANLLVAPSAAFALAKFKFKASRALLFVYIVVMMMPFQVLAVPNYMAVNFLKLLDTRWAIILPSIFMPFSVFLLRQFMVRLPDELMEAATVDGASTYQVFFNIVLPICKPALMAVGLLTFAQCWNIIEQPMILLENPGLYPLSLFLSNMISGAKDVVFAGSVLYLLPVVLLFSAFSEYLIIGVQLSRVK